MNTNLKFCLYFLLAGCIAAPVFAGPMFAGVSDWSREFKQAELDRYYDTVSSYAAASSNVATLNAALKNSVRNTQQEKESFSDDSQTKKEKEDSDATELFARLSKMKTLVGQFEQKLIDSEGVVLQNTQGEFKLKRPGNFYWKVSPPFEQVVIGNAETLWVYDPDLEQVTVRPQSNIENTPVAILSGNFDAIDEHYEVSRSGAAKNKSSQRYTLKSRGSSQLGFSTLTFLFEQDELAELELLDNLGQTTSIAFKQVQLNTQLEDTLFSFDPPPFVDVIVDQP